MPFGARRNKEGDNTKIVNEASWDEQGIEKIILDTDQLRIQFTNGKHILYDLVVVEDTRFE